MPEVTQLISEGVRIQTQIQNLALTYYEHGKPQKSMSSDLEPGGLVSKPTPSASLSTLYSHCQTECSALSGPYDAYLVTQTH